MAYVKCLMNVISSTLPDGKTVTPTDDVSILLACAGRTETYTTISALLADATALAGVISSNNAIDYLVRSTTFASDMCADQGAMADIGVSNYASNTLLANSTWCSAICNSTYFESVLNVKVPTMTSNTTPSGECSASSIYNTTYPAWKAFDNDNSTEWNPANTDTYGNVYVGYKFTSSISINKIIFVENPQKAVAYTLQLKGSNDDFTTSNIIADDIPVTTGSADYSFSNIAKYDSYRLYIKTGGGTMQQNEVRTVQFYGRADV